MLQCVEPTRDWHPASALTATVLCGATAMADAINTPAEEWRAIPGFDGYEVSSLGRVRSLDRDLPLRSRWGQMTVRKYRGRMLVPRLHTGGYLRISAGKQKDLFIHRVVAMAFHGQPPTPNHEVAHLNGNKEDNRPKNLIWATPVENAAHKIDHGTHSRGERNGVSKLRESQVVEILARYAQGQSGQLLSDEFKVSRGLIAGIVGGRIWLHVDSEFRQAAKQRAAENILSALEDFRWRGGKSKKVDKHVR